jgi:hypothetical protein
MLFNLQPEQLCISAVVNAWEKQMSSKRHMDVITGGDQSYLNSAKEILIGWIKENPNQGRGDDPNQPAGVPRQPMPGSGSSAIALPEPEVEEENEP